jgi:hypothetical protein
VGPNEKRSGQERLVLSQEQVSYQRLDIL